MGQFTVYPSQNDIAVVTDEGRVGQEITHKEYAETWVGNHILSGFTLPATTSGTLAIDVATGEAVIDGRRVQMGSIESPVMAASQTNHIFLQLTFDGNSLVDGVQIVSNTTGVPPSNSVKIGEAVTDATEVTSTTDTRPLGPYKDSKVFGPALSIDLGGDTGGAVALVGGGGDTTLAGLSVSITRENLQGIDTKVFFIAIVSHDGQTSGSTYTYRIKDGATVLATTVVAITTDDMHVTIMGVATLLGSADHTITVTGAIGAGNANAADGQLQCLAVGKG